jgi:hypothetical protein
MATTKPLELDEVDTLIPIFDGRNGWLRMTHLNYLDPNCIEFDIIDQVTFIDDTVFVLVRKYSRCR